MNLAPIKRADGNVWCCPAVSLSCFVILTITNVNRFCWQQTRLGGNDQSVSIHYLEFHLGYMGANLLGKGRLWECFHTQVDVSDGVTTSRRPPSYAPSCGAARTTHPLIAVMSKLKTSPAAYRQPTLSTNVFFYHAVGLFFLSLLEYHNCIIFNIYCFGGSTQTVETSLVLPWWVLLLVNHTS